MKIAVIGLGKIGLPLAVQFATKGFITIGLDINEETVTCINQGKEPFPGEKDLQQKLASVVSTKHLFASSNPVEALRDAAVIVVAVPLIVDANNEIDFGLIDGVTSQIAQQLKRGTLICYETTLPIGTTKQRFARKLEESSGLTVGKDFFVVFSPERVLTGRVFQDLSRYPKILGGVTRYCATQGEQFYTKVLDFDERIDLERPNGVWDVGSSEAAEFVKLAETTYRDVNIGLANQFAMYADQIGVSIETVIESANSQSYSHIHQPGISVGGHCIPIYPRFYLHNDKDASIVRSARDVNSFMPTYFVNKLYEIFDDLTDKKVLVLGVTYRPGVKEVAFSGAFEVQKRLIELGALPYFHDSLISQDELINLKMEPAGDRIDFDTAIIHTSHSDYESFDFSKYSKMKYVIDGRGILGMGLGVVKLSE